MKATITYESSSEDRDAEAAVDDERAVARAGVLGDVPKSGVDESLTIPGVSPHSEVGEKANLEEFLVA
jgi:hypothetical protein